MASRMRLREDDLEWREAEGEILVLDRRRGRYFAVSEAGAVLWTELARGASQDSLVARLRDRYDIEQRRAREDVTAFLTWLDEKELLVR